MVLLRGHNQNLGSERGTTIHWVQMLGERINCSPTAAALIGRNHGSLQSPSNCFQMWAVRPGSNQPASNTELFDCTQTWPVQLPNKPPAPPLAHRLGLTLCVRLSKRLSMHLCFSVYTYVLTLNISEWSTVIQELYIM